MLNGQKIPIYATAASWHSGKTRSQKTCGGSDLKSPFLTRTSLPGRRLRRFQFTDDFPQARRGRQQRFRKGQLNAVNHFIPNPPQGHDFMKEGRRHARDRAPEPQSLAVPGQLADKALQFDPCLKEGTDGTLGRLVRAGPVKRAAKVERAD